jgi:MoxR-like ATPase
MVYLEKCRALIESKNFITPELAAMSEPLYLAKSEDGYPALLPQMANRHGLITGATGTGKTVTLQSMAERLSFAGVPVFMADVKGDLSGAGAAGVVSPKLQKADRGTRAGRLRTLRQPGRLLGCLSARAASRCVPPFPTWARCCWRACST